MVRGARFGHASAGSDQVRQLGTPGPAARWWHLAWQEVPPVAPTARRGRSAERMATPIVGRRMAGVELRIPVLVLFGQSPTIAFMRGPTRRRRRNMGLCVACGCGLRGSVLEVFRESGIRTAP